MSGFRWTKKREAVALMLAQAYTVAKTARDVGVTERTIYRWKNDLEFAAEVDRLSLMIGIASRAERLRIAMQVARQKVRDDGTLDTNRDLLDWLRFAQSETDGAKFDLDTIFQAMEAAASDESSQNGESGEPETGNTGKNQESR